MFDSNDVRINQQEKKCKKSLIQRFLKIGVLRKTTKNRTSYMTRGGVIFAMWNHYIEVKKKQSPGGLDLRHVAFRQKS